MDGHKMKLTMSTTSEVRPLLYAMTSMLTFSYSEKGWKHVCFLRLRIDRKHIAKTLFQLP